MLAPHILQPNLIVGISDGDRSKSRSPGNRAFQNRLARPEVLRYAPLRTLQQNLGNRALARLFQQTQHAPAVLPELNRKCACVREAKEECTECYKKRPVPGSEALNRSIGIVPRSIQRAKIDYRALTWDDFQGKAPANATFDAATYSDFVDPDLKAVIPKVAAKDTGDPCKGGKEKKFKADITIDPKGAPVKSFMWQEESWHQDWLTDEAAARKHCEKTGSPICEKAFDTRFAEIKKERTSAEKDCTDNFDAAKKKVDEDCKGTEKECKDLFGKDGASYRLGSATAHNAKECTTVILPECSKTAMAGVTFTANFTGGTATAKTRKECGKEFGEAFEKLAKGDAKVTMNSSDKSASVTVSDRKDCRKGFLDDCAKTLAGPDRAYVLSHEQRHFDLTNAMAQKSQTDLQDLINTFPKDVVDCGKDATENNAKAKLADELGKLQKAYKASQTALASKQTKYDDDTKHGANLDKQAEWSAVIDKGFLDTP